MSENKKINEIKEAEEAFEGTLRGELHFLNLAKDVLIFKGLWYNKKEAYEIIEIKTSKAKFKKIEAVFKKYGEFDMLQRPLTGKRLYRVRMA